MLQKKRSRIRNNTTETQAGPSGILSAEKTSPERNNAILITSDVILISILLF